LQFWTENHDRAYGLEADFLCMANAVQLGDVFVNNLYPYIDLDIDLGSNGKIDGYFPAIDEVLARVDETQVIPGPGPLATKRELKACRDKLQTVRDRVAALRERRWRRFWRAIRRANSTRSMRPTAWMAMGL
jgi:glyoxylase-like metal-dependent hydrolase (beta-lactamase superfamily II)